jgi:8-oxo-dGTP pyrophosphatase MutT (NUDIX family)
MGRYNCRMKRAEVKVGSCVNEFGQWPVLRVVRAIILSPDQKSLLIVYRSGSHFTNQGENAGGKVNEGANDIRKELQRELFEELSISEASYDFIDDDPFLDLMMFDPKHSHTPNTPYKNKLILTTTYVVRLKNGSEPIIASEHSGMKWVPITDFRRENNLTPYTYSTLAAFEKNNGRVTMSALPGRSLRLNTVTYPTSPMPTETTAQSGDFLTAALR